MKSKLVIGAALLAMILAWWIISIYPDWLWFGKLNYLSVFWTILLSKFLLGLTIWLILLIITSLSLYWARRSKDGFGSKQSHNTGNDYLSQLGLSGKSVGYLFIGFALILSIGIALRGSSQWDLILRYFHQQPFGSKDPIFNKDIGFFVFSLPFYMFVQNGLIALFVFSGLLTILWQLKNGAIQITNVNEFIQAERKQIVIPKITIAPGAIKQLVFFGCIIVLLLAWGYRLKMFTLLYSTQGAAFGAGYTDIHVRLLAFWVLVFVSLVFALVLFSNIFRSGIKLIWISGGVWIGAILLFSTIIPVLVQKIVVKPNELAKESPYIAYNIHYTRDAYNLNKIKEVSFPVIDKLTVQDITSHNTTIQNIRIWDKRPLLRTYSQLQSIRMYYDFHDVDVDRYHFKNAYRQVMLSARELAVDQLPPQANTWVNRHLIYTHGYGLASSPVNDVTSEGLPNLIIKDLPPSIDVDIKIDHPEIYYGEKTDEYVFVKTKTKEFDYPKGDKNVYTRYQGTGGVSIGSFLRKALFSLSFLDSQILFTSYIESESRIMYNRSIDRRVRMIAPFLNYDGDPYLVVSGGRIYWLQDAYTTSNVYPYSSRSYGYFGKGLNYIRNSVKVVIDAYNGNVSFYIIDEKDPIIKTYSQIFPGLFKPFNEMSSDMKRHIRYPKDLFRVQAGIYRTYHMKDVQVFYNQEDLWEIPDEIYGNSRQEMESYHIIIRLPEEEKEEFVLMLPFVPSKKDNMIAWLAARCDLPNYGNLIVYKLGKEKLVFGPMQIEARVDQQTEISKEMTLWGQRGSTVIRGNLLVIPIRKTFIYVEPIYLEAKQSEAELSPAASPNTKGLRKSKSKSAEVTYKSLKSGSASLPELKRVIVAFGNKVVMKGDIESALLDLLGKEIPTKELASPAIAQHPGSAGSASLALEHFDKAKAYLHRGDWTGYGRELEILEKILNEMAATTNKK